MSVKDELRYKLKIKRKYFYGVRRETADIAIAENFLAAYENYESFFIYNSFSTEADTSLIIKSLLAAGKRVYLPRVEGDGLCAVPYSENTVKSSLGIEEPQGAPYTGEAEVTVIPLLAVNKSGFRIGYGRGYYDRYLKDRHTERVGLGYSFQIENFKEDGWDIPLDKFVCEKGIYTYEADG